MTRFESRRWEPSVPVEPLAKVKTAVDRAKALAERIDAMLANREPPAEHDIDAVLAKFNPKLAADLAKLESGVAELRGLAAARWC